MKYFGLFTDDGKRQKLRVRSRVWPPHEHENGLPACVWCGHGPLIARVDIVQAGFFNDHYQTICECEHCHRGTCLTYRLPLENEPLHQDSATFDAAEKSSIETPVPVTRG